MVIPSHPTRKPPREVGRHLYRTRRVIGHFFNRPKQYRAGATRHDKTARDFPGAIYLAAAVVWLN